jgi:hypothetical protein
MVGTRKLFGFCELLYREEGAKVSLFWQICKNTKKKKKNVRSGLGVETLSTPRLAKAFFADLDQVHKRENYSFELPASENPIDSPGVALNACGGIVSDHWTAVVRDTNDQLSKFHFMQFLENAPRMKPFIQAGG